MKAMILAAGLGTRLRPLTDTHPKALVEINGRTLLEITLSRLRSFGINEVIVNVHHLADMVVDYLKSHDNFGMRIEVSREDDLLLDTGGGLKKASWFFLEHHRSPAAQGAIRGALRPSLPQPEKDKRGGVIPSLPAEEGAAWDKLLPRQGTALAVPERDQDQRALAPEAGDQREEPFLLHNVDVITSIDFRRMLQFHNSFPSPSPASTSFPVVSSPCSLKKAPSPSSTPIFASPPRVKKSSPSALTITTGATSAAPPTSPKPQST